MKIYFYIYLNQIYIFNRIVNKPMQEFNKITVYNQQINNNLVLVSIDYDKYINLLDQNKIEILSRHEEKKQKNFLLN